LVLENAGNCTALKKKKEKTEKEKEKN